MKILLLDIETAPNLVHVWGLWQQNVGINQIMASGYTLCFSAKWYGEEKIIFDSVFTSPVKRMLKRVHTLLEEADAVIHYNGTKFDIPTLNKEFILYGMKPPAPYKQIDLLKTARSQFRFPSNKLDYVAQALGLGKKTHGMTHDLWVQCMARDLEAWKKMETYNRNDVILLEKVYDRMKPWIKGHANHSLYTGEIVCPNCGSHHLTKRGFAYTNAGKYQRLQCTDCGAWSKTGGTLAKKPNEKTQGL
jgi:DNA-directed RNA polymerase subunit RPC12/RpoP